MKSTNAAWLVLVVMLVAVATRLASHSPDPTPTPRASATPTEPPYLTYTEFHGSNDYVFSAGRRQGANVLYQARLGQRSRQGTIALEHYAPWMESVIGEAQQAVSEEPQGNKRAEVIVGRGGQSWNIIIGQNPGPASARLLKLLNGDFPGWEKNSLLRHDD